MRSMHRVAALALVVAGVMMSASALASFPGTDVYLPSVGRGSGAAGSQWYTAMWVHNPTSSPANVQIFFLRRDQANPSPPVFNVAVPAGDTMRTDDAITVMFGTSGYGALRIVSDQKVLVNSRIYSRPERGELHDSVGQFFAAIPASFAIASGQSTTLLGVYQTAPQADSQFRYNFGFVETTGSAATVRVTAYDETGAAAGNKNYTLAGYEAKQLAITDLLPGVNSQNLRLGVEVVAGSGKVVAFGSSLANKSNDPSTFEMGFREELLGSGGGGLSSVSHDPTMSGDGTSTAPLGVANGGVTPDKLSTTGSTSGQVLTSDGSAVAWKSPGGLTLPYSGTGASSGALLGLVNSGGGHAVVATNSAAGNYVELASGARALRAVAFVGAGVLAQSSTADGVIGESAVTGKSGVYGFNSDASGYGVFGRNSGSGSVGYVGGLYGVWGVASHALVHGGYFETSGGLAAGVYGKSTANLGYGGVFEATGDGSYGLLAVGPAAPKSGLAAIFRGNVEVRHRSTEAVLIELGEGLDYAEGFATESDARIAPGSVLVIDDAQPGQLALATRPYDRRVAGVVAGANKLGSGIRLAPGQFDHDVALAGRVYCNVDASYGEVKAGDLLTTSPTPGHAMVARNSRKATGAILGKAMQPLGSGQRGQILVLVTLQ